MSNFKKLSAYVDVPCEWVSSSAPCNDKLDQLNAENAKLRTQLADVTESVGRVEERCAKLRELCADMHECLEDECKRCHEWGDMCDLEYEMRKLGVMG